MKTNVISAVYFTNTEPFDVSHQQYCCQ